jgi:diguanylate cyclase (GGDEF)-like protein/PAS domain S-box-containing protein
MNVESPLRVLIIDDSDNDAERHASALRNARLAVRPTRASDAEKVHEILRAASVDLILCSENLAQTSARDTLHLLEDEQVNIPLVVIVESPSPDRTLQALRAGACDVVARDDPEHLQLVAVREARNLEHRRALARLRVQLKENEDRCRTLIDGSRDAIIYTHEGMYIHANPAFLNMFGYLDPSEIEGLPIMDMVAPEEQRRFKEFLRAYARQPTKAATLEIRGQHNDGSLFDAMMELWPATIDGEACTQIIIRDQASKKALEEKIQLLTRLDTLTGLFSRQHFIEQLEQAFADWQEKQVASDAVLCIGLDNFENVRSTAGIAASDGVLAELGELLKERMDDTDLCARFGDDVFTLCARGRDPAAVEAFAEQIRASISDHAFKIPGKFVPITSSIGIAYFSKHATDSQELVDQAFAACEMARSEGANRVNTHNPLKALENEPEKDKHYVQLARYALEKDHLRLFFQPIVSLKGDKTETYEALLRLKAQEGENIRIEELISALEGKKIMTELDRWIIATALRVLSEERQRGREIRFFVKLSGTALAEDSTLIWILDCMRETKIQPQWVVFEAADENVRNDLQAARRFAEQLKKIKSQFAVGRLINDSHLSGFLKHLPVDYLKLDGSLTKSVASTPEKQQTIQQINTLAHSSGVKTIATHIEDANSLAALWTAGVDYMQGNFLQEPSPNLDYEFSAD